mgnify:CR=1 FL=1
MMKLIKMAGAAALTLTAVMPGTAALAHDRDGYGYQDGDDRDDGYRGGYGRGNQGWRGRDYDDSRYYQRRGYDDRTYRVYSYRPVRYRCGDGTTGLIIGGVLGGLLGRSVAGDYGDRTAGAIIGGGAGALAGRAIDRSDDRCRR